MEQFTFASLHRLNVATGDPSKTAILLYLSHVASTMSHDKVACCIHRGSTWVRTSNQQLIKECAPWIAATTMRMRLAELVKAGWLSRLPDPKERIYNQVIYKPNTKRILATMGMDVQSSERRESA